MVQRELKLEDGKSKKFWRIERRGSTQTVTYGRLGTKGLTLVTDFTTTEEAKESYDRLVKQKLRKGYVDSAKGKNTSQTKRRSSRSSSNIAKTTTKHILTKTIYREAERLGADTTGTRELPKSVKRCPAFIAEFYRGQRDGLASTRTFVVSLNSLDAVFFG